MAEATPPTIEFPCEDYPVKIIGVVAPEFSEYVLTVVERHAPGFDAERIEMRESSGGRYLSITCWITATGEEQLANLNSDLRRSSLVKLVL